MAGMTWTKVAPGPDKGPLPLNRWVHLALVCDGRKVRVYADGRKVAGYEVHGNVGQTANPLSIGRPVDPGAHFPGMVREVRISTTARYTDDFQPAWRFEPDRDTVLLLHCNEANGALLRDSSGQQNNVKSVARTIAGCCRKPASALRRRGLCGTLNVHEAPAPGAWRGRRKTFLGQPRPGGRGMFIDYVPLILINMSAAFLILAFYLLTGIEREDRAKWAPAFGIAGLVAFLGGLHIIFTWPLPSILQHPLRGDVRDAWRKPTWASPTACARAGARPSSASTRRWAAWPPCCWAFGC